MVFRVRRLVARLSVPAPCTLQSDPPADRGSRRSRGRSAGPRRRPILPREIGGCRSPIPTQRCRPMSTRVGRSSSADRTSPAIPAFSSCSICQLPNAHAVTGCVSVTRGFSPCSMTRPSLPRSAAGLGRLVQRHAAQRHAVGALRCRGRAATVAGSITVGRSVARDGLLALRRLSRDQELEAARSPCRSWCVPAIAATPPWPPDREAGASGPVRAAAHGRSP